MKKINEVLLKDTLYNTHERSGASVDYGKGCVVGVAATLMAARGILLADALVVIKRNLPEGWRVDCMPESWRQ